MSDEAPVVFVVDDDISVRELLELLIRSAGWFPETSEPARAFLSRPRAVVPNCLVLDVNLPDLAGRPRAATSRPGSSPKSSAPRFREAFRPLRQGL